MAGIFQRLTDEQGMRFVVTVEAVGGQTLAWHAVHRSGVFAQAWDAVVAQDFSTLPLPAEHGGNPAAFHDGTTAVQGLVDASSADADFFLYETWASPAGAVLQKYGDGAEGLRLMQSDVRAGYAAAAQQLEATAVAPVGDAFERAVEDKLVDALPAGGLDPGTVSLWSGDDHRHANELGSYLAAVVLYATITERDPRALPTGESSTPADLGILGTTAARLHDIAHALAPATESGTPIHDAVPR